MNQFGAVPKAGGTEFAVWAPDADRVELALLAPTEQRLSLQKGTDGVHRGFADGVGPGAHYGFRAHGCYAPDQGLWFDPAKLLVDPYALAIDRAYAMDSRLATFGVDTADLVPRSVVVDLPDPPARAAPRFRPGGLIYELPVKAFTTQHPDVPPPLRGTLRALAQPAVIAHLQKLRVSAVELMPIVAWIDERHLVPLGLHNGWGYNPVTFMALDPRLAPGGIADLRAAVQALHAAGIGVILDVVFNHSGESDALGPTLSLRGLAARHIYRHADGALVNDSGCGNTIACDHPMVRQMIRDSLRHFVQAAGVDGFRFDLAPILGRTVAGFDPQSALLRELAADPWLADRVMIAEPWDIGPGGYRLGQFPENWLEWNDRYRDDVRRFWRGDAGAMGPLATRLAGSSDLFAGAHSRTVNFLAAHDGFTLADLVAHEQRHNLANGEQNRDGHGENLSWNNGVEGASDDPAVQAARGRDVRALLATLFASRGTLLLTAGDEFGRSQRGNNNAYAQDNGLTWLDWAGRDTALEDFVAQLAALRAGQGALGGTQFLAESDVSWLAPDGMPLAPQDWQQADAMLMHLHPEGFEPLAIAFNRLRHGVDFVCPDGRRHSVAARSVQVVSEAG